MADIMEYLFGPLPKKYCDYFYFVSIFMYIIFLFSVFSFIGLFFAKKSLPLTAYVLNLFIVLYNFVLYFVSRLLHSMCVNSL
jgi:hypothetical protein